MARANAPFQVYIGIPHNGWINSRLVQWLTTVVLRHPMDPINIHTVNLRNDRPLEQNVNGLVDDFFKTEKCTHLLFMDDDVIPDKELLKRLLDYDVDIVGSSVLIWRDEFEGPMTCVAKKNPKNPEKYTYVNTVQDNENKPLKEVDFVGAGIMLVKRHVLEKMSKPYFKRIFNEDGKMIVGCDLYFCQRAIDLGFKVHVDQVEAIGQIVELNLDDVLSKNLKLFRKFLKK